MSRATHDIATAWQRQPCEERKPRNVPWKEIQQKDVHLKSWQYSLHLVLNGHDLNEYAGSTLSALTRCQSPSQKDTDKLDSTQGYEARLRSWGEARKEQGSLKNGLRRICIYSLTRRHPLSTYYVATTLLVWEYRSALTEHPNSNYLLVAIALLKTTLNKKYTWHHDALRHKYVYAHMCKTKIKLRKAIFTYTKHEAVKCFLFPIF